MTLDEVNGLDRAAFVAALGAVFEHAPWVAERAWAARPFACAGALHAAMFGVVEAAGHTEQVAFLNNHPELAGGAVLAPDSASEQGGLGLDRLAGPGLVRLQSMNAAYRARFGLPFIICVRRHTRASILAEFARRLQAEPADEHAAALAEVRRITGLRLAGLVEGMPRIRGGLSTHVLDTQRGRPAAGVRVELLVHEPEGAEALVDGVTDADGRVPLIAEGAPLRIGRYELRFHVGPYFGGADPAWYDVIPVRIGIAEAEAHYHVPLLCTPWTYTTYRGS